MLGSRSRGPRALWLLGGQDTASFSTPRKKKTVQKEALRLLEERVRSGDQQ